MKLTTVQRLIVTGVIGLIVYACTGLEMDDNVSYTEESLEKPRRPHTFGEAVMAVSNSDMSSIDKMYAIDEIISSGDSDYYEGIIGIANGSMSSIDKMYAIQNLSKYESETNES